MFPVLRCKGVRASVDRHVYEGLATVAYAPGRVEGRIHHLQISSIWDTVLKEARQIPLQLPTNRLILSVVRIR